MFVKFALPLFALAAGVFASPLSVEQRAVVSRNHNHNGPTSFNTWGGFHSLDNFDNFYGVDNFAGFHRKEVLESTQDVVCHSQAIEIIQQRLLVLQEMAKRITTETICEVEIQTIVFEQYYASLGKFHGDLRRHSGFHAGYDRDIVSHFGRIYGSDGLFSTDSWGFSGSDAGLHTIIPSGGNWRDETSPRSVDAAFYAARNSY
ncbi:hypothetical protein FB45DRAFT_14809 [Roridomyces roridus]|uniref:Uncharacterized protein n=1 Tax=Roridomyces roridus TaxID=1738132 RepID=A0AAD7CJ38_9AGAR|nr:hypothetical protein FB45DRAFT_14809 [Roridomyces roridus]